MLNRNHSKHERSAVRSVGRSHRSMRLLACLEGGGCASCNVYQSKRIRPFDVSFHAVILYRPTFHAV